MKYDLPHGAQAGPISHREPSNWNGIAIVGEAPGRQEILNGEPFTGPAGDKLNVILERLSLVRSETLIINCFRHQPAWSVDARGKRRNNDIQRFFTLDETLGNKHLPTYRGRWLHDDLSSDLRSTWRVLKQMKPRAIALMGATALWGIAGQEGIRDNRGKLLDCEHWQDTQILATYHTAFGLHRKDESVFDAIESDLRQLAA